jgi:hypothetical protein
MSGLPTAKKEMGVYGTVFRRRNQFKIPSGIWSRFRETVNPISKALTAKGYSTLLASFTTPGVDPNNHRFLSLCCRKSSAI